MMKKSVFSICYCCSSSGCSYILNLGAAAAAGFTWDFKGGLSLGLRIGVTAF